MARISLALPLLLCLALGAALHGADAGVAAYGICQTGCNSLAAACYGAGGSVFGTVAAAFGAPASILGCNKALGACMSSCVAAGLTPSA
ncbi:hypothetical protein HYH03_015487 [Edaphochlamys debaryana]|uniref:Zygote-specific protein n=1 Tax=Edaphochlamys debaryana TaxID=47281 RepID=A0A835XLN3_9CHLO|nr:hypothetical protein HYH03_015487 [Edaphochlamys debaryana]|eukprot:KAG2485774.1 hypothetical protein HYH03_015487 [Edaphochlamys debaryana]